ncbi:cytochrome P450 [Streptomyces sp. NL15-2K]|uniref:cytochrome P450 n=1 Tax=Streptomyces sp. NL15-2K TaxID=376149 RepID=UPI000FF9A00E|nr:cytochrome P450 family protein [Streptomyces sp. NL15-2K]
MRYADLDQLPYVRKVLQEAVRKYGPAWMVTRTATQDVDLGGHRIPEGADVVWSPYLHQHDADYFPQPGLFDPDRWTPERAPATRGSFLAFGDGRRKCIGENFAWSELHIILATVLQLWPRLELTSRPPRAKAVVTVKPDTMTMAFHRMPTPAADNTTTPARRPQPPAPDEPAAASG